jgi:hypothetical protein
MKPFTVQGNGHIVHGTSANCDQMNIHLSFCFDGKVHTRKP